MTETQRKLAKQNGTLDAIYAALVSQKIRSRYTLTDELAILRQRDEKPDEFAAYNAYAEKCKAQAHLEIYGEEVTA